MYDQGGTDPAPIRWQVLSSSGGKLVMISERILEIAAFDGSGQPYANSDIKAWLNGSFYDNAFTNAEKAALSGDAGSKVSLLSLEDAQSAYYPDDASRAAIGTAYTGPADEWWLEDDSADPANAIYVGGTGAIAAGGYAKTTSAGVRPVISVDVSAIALVLEDDTLSVGFGTSADGTLEQAVGAVSPYTLAVKDSSLPSLTISDYTADDDGLTVTCGTSAPLSGDQKVFCYMQTLMSGSPVMDYIGWASLTDGEVHFSGFPLTQYKVMLAVGLPTADQMTCYVGAAEQIEKVEYIKIAGIEEGDRFGKGTEIPFEAIGSGLSNDDPEDYDTRWMPESWSVDTQSGTWTDAPYTDSLTFEDTGEYTLAVTFKEEYYESGVWRSSATVQTCSVTFNVDEALTLTASPADGRIYTGGRITITPSSEGGTWGFDSEYLSRSGNTFTGLKAGTTRITYTIGAQSPYIDVVISASELPSTGQDSTWIWILGGATVLALAGAVIVKKIGKSIKI